MSNLVKAIFSPKDQELPKVCAKLAAEECVYPGIKAKFKYNGGNWELGIPMPGNTLVRQICFKSETQDSLFKNFWVLGHKNGSVSICVSIDFRKTNSSELLDYFRSNGLVPESIDIKDNFFETKNKKDCTTLFRIVDENNDIPEEHFSFIRDLVKSGDWRKVTPIPYRDGCLIM
jgi:hypothetical protein